MSNQSSSVIRDAQVNGLVFCSSSSPSNQSLLEEAEQNGLRQGLLQGYEIGKREGFEKGFQEGQAVTRTTSQKETDLFAKLVDEFKQHQERLFASLKSEMIQLCLQISETILKRELSSPDSLVKQIHLLLDQAQALMSEAVLQVHLSPRDYERAIDKLSQQEWKNLAFISDENIGPGNIRLSNDVSMLHFDVKRLLNEFEERLMEGV